MEPSTVEFPEVREVSAKDYAKIVDAEVQASTGMNAKAFTTAYTHGDLPDTLSASSISWTVALLALGEQ